MKVDFRKSLNILIEFFLLAAVFVTPVIFAWFPKGNNVFEWPKNIWLMVLIAGFLLFLLARECWYGFDKGILQKKVLLLPGFFLLSIVIAWFFSSNHWLSFFGSYDRSWGLLSWIMLIAFGYGIYYFVRDDRNRLRRILLVALISASVVAIYAVLQFIGIDFINWTEPAILTSRATSTMGQSNFLGSFLLLTLFLPVYFWKQSAPFLERLLLLFSGLLQLIAIFLTLSRGALLGLFAGIGCFLILRLKKKQLLLAVITGIIICLAFFGLSNLWRQRLLSAFDFKNGSVAIRLEFWQSGVSGIKTHPLWGLGPDNLESYYFTHYQENWSIFGNINSRNDRAHNFLIDTWLEFGVLGLVFYLTIIISALVIACRHREHRLNLVLASGIVAYLISLMFGFEFVAGRLYLWLWLFLIFMVNRHHWHRVNLKLRRFLAIPMILLLLICYVLGVNFYVRQLQFDYDLLAMKRSLLARDYHQAAWYYNNALIISPTRQADATILFVNDIFSNQADADFLTLYKPYWRQYLLPGTDFRAQLANVQLLSLAGDNDSALIELKSLQKLASQYPELYEIEASILWQQGKSLQAIGALDAAIKLLPDINDARLNFAHRQNNLSYRARLWYRSGDIYFAMGDYVSARKQYHLALDASYNITLYKKIADCYFQENNLTAALFFLQRAYLLDRQQASWPYAIGMVYYQLKDFDQAIKYLEQVTPQSPDVSYWLDRIKLEKSGKAR